MKLCPIQEVCPKYSNGTKRRGHHIRGSNPCVGFLDMSCEMGIQLQAFITGKPIACNIEKIKRIKGRLNAV